MCQSVATQPQSMSLLQSNYLACNPALPGRLALNQALAVSQMCDLVSCYLPLSVPLPGSSVTTTQPLGLNALCLPPASAAVPHHFHTSAVLAAAIDTLLLPTVMHGARGGEGRGGIWKTRCEKACRQNVLVSCACVCVCLCVCVCVWGWCGGRLQTACTMLRHRQVMV
jgi:hypothetical protein